MLVVRFFKPKAYGGAESLRFRIALADTGTQHNMRDACVAIGRRGEATERW